MVQKTNNGAILKTLYNSTNHSTALIEKCWLAPYYGANIEEGYRLWIYDEDNFLYYVSVFEIYEDAIGKLRSFTWDV